ncbi:MAG: putative membrane protein YecN with MAPEG domain [Kiritimatiellia bacterium]|jgi:uncharacterized membrane protein YecN with MAPEG domain
MASSLYAAILGLLICCLALKVIAVRRKNKILYADGGVTELQIARSAHSNATEYIPISVLLLFALEYSGGHTLVIHCFGLAVVVGRLIHCRGILLEKLKGRVLGMKITLFSIIGLSVLNIIYFLHHSIFT